MHGLVSGQDVALLTDRALVGQGKPQRYGTQFVGYDNTAAIKMQPTADIGKLDARRAAIGLPPMNIYACVLRAAYGKPVVPLH